MKNGTKNWWQTWVRGMANLVPRFGGATPAPLPTDEEAWLADEAAIASDWAVVGAELRAAMRMVQRYG